MSVVLNFLSTIVSDESNGSIKRMLSLCSEFERISKAVIDKAERESHSKKKRKADQQGAEDRQNTQADENETRQPPSPPQNNFGASGMSPASTSASTSALPTSSLANGVPVNTSYSTDDGVAGLGSDALNLPGLAGFGQAMSPDVINQATMGSHPGLNGQMPFSTVGTTAPDMQSFQHPFIPQDLWQLPVSLEWNWTEMLMGSDDTALSL